MINFTRLSLSFRFFVRTRGEPWNEFARGSSRDQVVSAITKLPASYLWPPLSPHIWCTTVHHDMESCCKTESSWQNVTRCRDGVKVLWCHSHLVRLVSRVQSLHVLVFVQTTFCDFVYTTFLLVTMTEIVQKTLKQHSIQNGCCHKSSGKVKHEQPFIVQTLWRLLQSLQADSWGASPSFLTPAFVTSTLPRFS